MNALLACDLEAASKGGRSGCPLPAPSPLEWVPAQVWWLAAHQWVVIAAVVLVVAYIAIPRVKQFRKAKPAAEEVPT